LIAEPRRPGFPGGSPAAADARPQTKVFSDPQGRKNAARAVRAVHIHQQCRGNPPFGLWAAFWAADGVLFIAVREKWQFC
jgi:hypothetical protein